MPTGVFKHREGNWGFRADVPSDNGKRKQTKRVNFPTMAAASWARIQFLASKGQAPPDRSASVVASVWFVEFIESRVLRPTTRSNYRYCFELIDPHLGMLPLSSITESELRQAYRALVRAGYSTSTIQNVHDRVKNAFKQAVKETRMLRNCAENVLPPKGHPPKPTDTWTFDQLQQFARYVANERDRAMWGVWMTTGLRRGELLGLKWDRVDFGRDELRIDWQRTMTMEAEIVEGEVKTPKAVRTVTPPSIVMSGLREWQLAQVPSEYVFTSRYNQPYHPSSLEKRLKKLAGRAGLPLISPHDLRHTFGTRAVENGMEIKLLSTLMGHARVETTLNLYVHPNTDAAHVASEELAARMFS